MNEKVPQLEDLNVWKISREFRKKIFEITKRFSVTSDRFGLMDQMLRASRSITNNIAEGYGRFNYQENIQYLRISRGSVYECMDHLYCCLDESKISKDEFKEIYDLANSCLRLT